MTRKSKPDGYWKSLDNVVAEASSAIAENNWPALPGVRALSKAGYPSLGSAISKYHGWSDLRRTLGEQKSSLSGWQDLEYTIKQARKAIDENEWSSLPNSNILIQAGYASLSNAIGKYHSWSAMRSALGETNARVKRGSWQNLDYALKQALKAMAENEWTRLPSSHVLAKTGYSNLAHAIDRYHSWREVRCLLGESKTRIRTGSWKDLRYTLQEARKAMKEHKWSKLPTCDILNDQGLSSLGHSITKYHGWFAFRRALGEPSVRAESGSWQNLDYTLEQAAKVMEENEWSTFPSSNALRASGYSSLDRSIGKYHGGYTYFRRLLAESQGRPSEKDQLESLLNRYSAQENNDT